MLIHVTHLPTTGGSFTVEVEAVRNTSVHVILTRARSLGLEFDLENSDVFLNSQKIDSAAWRSTEIQTDSLMLVKRKAQRG